MEVPCQPCISFLQASHSKETHRNVSQVFCFVLCLYCTYCWVQFLLLPLFISLSFLPCLLSLSSSFFPRTSKSLLSLVTSPSYLLLFNNLISVRLLSLTGLFGFWLIFFQSVHSVYAFFLLSFFFDLRAESYTSFSSSFQGTYWPFWIPELLRFKTNQPLLPPLMDVMPTQSICPYRFVLWDWVALFHLNLLRLFSK